MRIFLALLLPLLLLPTFATSTHAVEGLLHYHSIQDEYPLNIATGTQLTYTFYEPYPNEIFSFNIPSGELPSEVFWEREYNYYESDAAGIGLDWDKLEDVMAGPPGKSAHLTIPGGQQTLVYFPLRFPEDFIDSYAKVDLDRINVRYQGRLNSTYADLQFFGRGYQVPEPSSALLSFVCLATLAMNRVRTSAE